MWCSGDSSSLHKTRGKKNVSRELYQFVIRGNVGKEKRPVVFIQSLGSENAAMCLNKILLSICHLIQLLFL